MLPYMSRSNAHQAIKFGWSIKYNVRNIFFFKTHAEKKASRIVLDLGLFFKKALYKVKSTDQHLSFNCRPPGWLYSPVRM